MKPIVADASIIVEYLLRTASGARLETVLTEPQFELHVPALCDVEVCSVLRRATLQGRLSRDRAYDALEDYLDLPLTRHGHTYLLGRMFGLRDNFSAYDATYLALAEWLEADLLTADTPLERAVRAHLEIPLV